ncbi:putative uncharacterized oxidoreductase [Neolecta irregularis DAH-3]|uniref:Uncharacterized oxidoreductase n=1 Tax=Neolecta irregularis (strain DAH-3) TaxID=1198029 RepID=A0A1U7LRH6_NEOID|nr:putative uncharacterized oxidoreductase [Neolecta irregularis DAH-3]|eukprot:OLL25121.1 putative uncharacterized oxidoreductase [Neolecta irregularis DAH-3]
MSAIKLKAREIVTRIVMPGDIILVSGISGFLAAHVLSQLLEKGYSVRGTVRDEKKRDWILEKYKTFVDENRLQVIIVPDAAREDAFEEAVKGMTFVIHIASPFHFKITDPKIDLLDPAIIGTRGLLTHAAKHSSIKRVVITSSFASILDPSYGWRPGYTYTEADWSPLTYEDGLAAKDDPFTAYRTSKVEAERTAWRFLETEKPSFDIVTICPPLIWGPMIHQVTLDTLNESNRQLWDVINGESNELPKTMTLMFADVRDVAKAHVSALALDKANERFVICRGEHSWQKAADILRRRFPEKQSRVPIGNPGENLPPHYKLSAEKAKRSLAGFENGFIDYETSLCDIAKQLWDMQAVKSFEH